VGALHHSLLAFFTPLSGGSPNADHIDNLYKITLYVALVIFIWSRAGSSTRSSSSAPARAPSPPRSAQHAPGGRLDERRGADPAGTGRAHLRQARLDREPAQLGYPGRQARGGNGLAFASAERKLAAERQALNVQVVGRQYIWQFIYPAQRPTSGELTLEELSFPVGRRCPRT